MKMPQIKVEHVISFSSEDPVHVVTNLLSQDPKKKWKCKNPGEKMASVVLQLEKASQISSIDIGNEHSAYVEVLVSRSGTTDDFKVLLVMSSFMSPLDSRQSQNINKVRMFKQEDLSEDVCKEKWDRVKIVCTQPFNRHVQYGLCFINLHSNNGENTKAQMQPSIGKFTLRPDSPDNLSSGSLFARRKEIINIESPKAAVAIRDASSAACSNTSFSPKLKTKLLTPKPKITTASVEDERSVKKQRNRDEILYDKDDDTNEKINKRIEKRDKEKLELKERQEKNILIKDKKPTPVKIQENNNSKQKTKDDNRETNNKRKKIDEANGGSNGSGNMLKKLKKEVTKKIFSKLLEGVVLVISGIQNPDRANLRSLALAMGAKYKPDWDNDSTHLICAFVNTPKFNQVKGKGKIVTRKWIEDCHSLRKRLPWRRYALDRNDKGDESEEEILEKVDSPVPSPNENDDSSDMDLEPGSDTDEKVAKILSKGKNSENNSPDIFSIDTASENTDDESNLTNGLQEFTTTLPNIFDNITFFLDDTFNLELHLKLKRYIMAYGGLLADDPTKDINFFITKKNAKVYKEIEPGVKCIQPDWIWQCHNAQDLVSYDDYIL